MAVAAPRSARRSDGGTKDCRADRRTRRRRPARSGVRPANSPITLHSVSQGGFPRDADCCPEALCVTSQGAAAHTAAAVGRALRSMRSLVRPPLNGYIVGQIGAHGSRAEPRELVDCPRDRGRRHGSDDLQGHQVPWLEGAVFGVPLREKIGELELAKRGLIKTKLRVHVLDPSHPSDGPHVGIEVIQSTFASWDMRPVSLTRAEARLLAEVLSQAADVSERKAAG